MKKTYFNPSETGWIRSIIVRNCILKGNYKGFLHSNRNPHHLPKVSIWRSQSTHVWIFFQLISKLLFLTLQIPQQRQYCKMLRLAFERESTETQLLESPPSLLSSCIRQVRSWCKCKTEILRLRNAHQTIATDTKTNPGNNYCCHARKQITASKLMVLLHNYILIIM